MSLVTGNTIVEIVAGRNAWRGKPWGDDLGKQT